MKKAPQFSKSGLVLLLVILACALGLLVSARSPSNAQQIVALAGTTWSGTDSDGDDYVFTFEEDGTLAYKSPSGSFRNAKWNQFKTAVYLQMNDHYSEYLGTVNGDVIEGRAWNVKQRTWTWRVSRNR